MVELSFLLTDFFLISYANLKIQITNTGGSVKNFRFFTFFLGIISCSFAFSDETQTQEQPPEKQKPHHLNVGYNVFQFDIDTTVNNDYVVDYSLIFFGTNFQYEYNKSDSWYTNVDYSYAMASDTISIKAVKHEPRYSYKYEVPQYKDYSILINLEHTIGYNFLVNDYNVIPYVGIGLTSLEKFVNDDGFKEFMPYTCVGCRASYALSSNFTLEIDGKLFQAFCSEKKINFYNHPSASPVKESIDDLGMQIATSIKWQVNKKFAWMFQPYFTKYNFNEKNHLVGVKMNLSFVF